MQRIETLEKFLSLIASKQELWSEQVLEFLNIPGEYFITLLDEKDNHMNKPKGKIYQDKRERSTFRQRHNSYTGDSAASMQESEIGEEEIDRIDKSFRASIDNDKYMMIEDYVGQQVLPSQIDKILMSKSI